MKVKFHARKAGHGRVKFTSIVLKKLSPRKSAVVLRCTGRHKGCPLKKKKVKRTGAKANLAKLLKRRALKPGAVVQIRATKKGYIGAVVNLKVTKRGAKLTKLCLPVGKKTPRHTCPR